MLNVLNIYEEVGVGGHINYMYIKSLTGHVGVFLVDPLPPAACLFEAPIPTVGPKSLCFWLAMSTLFVYSVQACNIFTRNYGLPHHQNRLGCQHADFIFNLLITIANSVDPDQACQVSGPDLDPNCLTV